MKNKQNLIYTYNRMKTAQFSDNPHRAATLHKQTTNQPRKPKEPMALPIAVFLGIVAGFMMGYAMAMHHFNINPFGG